jgi:hypothetical protein
MLMQHLSNGKTSSYTTLEIHRLNGLLSPNEATIWAVHVDVVELPKVS